MTSTQTPTQAQIEAAELAKWIKQFKWKSVDKDNMEFELRTTCYVKDALDRWAALTAAAQVGEAAFDYFAYYKKATDEAVNATIERCAQVAEQYISVFDKDRRRIAAAIRKLKEVDT